MKQLLTRIQRSITAFKQDDEDFLLCQPPEDYNYVSIRYQGQLIIRTIADYQQLILDADYGNRCKKCASLPDEPLPTREATLSEGARLSEDTVIYPDAWHQKKAA